jgi:hypothetical protein
MSVKAPATGFRALPQSIDRHMMDMSSNSFYASEIRRHAPGKTTPLTTLPAFEGLSEERVQDQPR